MSGTGRVRRFRDDPAWEDVRTLAATYALELGVSADEATIDNIVMVAGDNQEWIAAVRGSPLSLIMIRKRLGLPTPQENFGGQQP